jgi:hypothetical protein
MMSAEVSRLRVLKDLLWVAAGASALTRKCFRVDAEHRLAN